MIEAESFTIPSDFGGVVGNDTAASGGKFVSFWSNDSISKTVTTPAGTGITVRALGDQCNGAPSLTLAMDGTNVLTVSVSATTWTSYPLTRAVSAGSHTFTVSYTNDSKTSSCDRNLRFDSLTITGTGGGGGGGDTTPPSAPISLGATAGNASAALTWAPNTESDLAGYNVYRSTTTGGPYTKDNTALVTTRSYNDTGLTNGTKYYWVVQAVDTSTNTSGNSNEASTTPRSPRTPRRARPPG